MKRRILTACLCVFVLAFASVVYAQQAQHEQHAMKHEPGRVLISIYKVSPGKQMEFVKWFVAREEAEKEAGGGPTHWFTHQDGADWDFVAVTHLGSEKEEAERAAKLDEALKKKGVSTDIAAWLEFRQMVAAHTDTFGRGPYTATELLKLMQKK